MLIKKIKDEQYITEYPMPNFDRVDPNPPITDMEHATIALVTSGGIVPKGNPEWIMDKGTEKMKLFQPWNDTVRLLSGDWALQPGRKTTAFDVHGTQEIELPIQKGLHPAVRLLTFMLMTFIMIV